MHRTANGRFLDINSLKIQQERTIAVGNSRQNARGDILGPGGQIVKSRDEIMTEYYNAQKGTQLSDSPIYNNTDEANAAAVADIFAEPIDNGIEDIELSQKNQTMVNYNTPAPNTGGINDALARSQELAERLRNQRRRI
jgi:hypothetical protein